MDTTVLEPAIPEHLRTERTLPSKLPPNYQPPFPAYSARFPYTAKEIVMAVIGLQQQNPGRSFDAHQQNLLKSMSAEHHECSPRYWELAAYTDKEGYHNVAVVSYWETRSEYETWVDKSRFGVFWENLQPDEGIGWFREVFFPSIERFETVFSDDSVPEGAAHMRETVSGELQEHVYWGSMRDRLPASQIDELIGEPYAPAEDKPNTRKRRIRLVGRKNLALIRSGQDWSNTNPHERTLYLETMHPVLIEGMDFLSNSGSSIGCISNRFMTVVDPTDSSKPTDKTFGLSFFDDLASLETWSKQHKTHLNIFGGFIKYAAKLQNNVSLRLFHEVMVLKPEQQDFEYIGCHSKTGLLA